jgi:hypothetical protein
MLIRNANDTKLPKHRNFVEEIGEAAKEGTKTVIDTVENAAEKTGHFLSDLPAHIVHSIFGGAGTFIVIIVIALAIVCWCKFRPQQQQPVPIIAAPQAPQMLPPQHYYNPPPAYPANYAEMSYAASHSAFRKALQDQS